ncbi:putative carbonic anhydrase 3 [Dirofilaria immitis]|nr:putative carbonic anhydrase 3 [Dirofilaria immitis]
MGSKSRSSVMGKGEKSRRLLGDSSSGRQERIHRGKNSCRSSTPRKASTGCSSKVVPSKKMIHHSPTLRKSKPSPVNELDIMTLNQKEQQSKSGTRGKDGIQNRSERMQHRQFAGALDRRGLWDSRNSGFGMRQGMDYRRTPMYPLRRGIGGSDLADQRTHYGRNGRQPYQRSIEQKNQRTMKKSRQAELKIKPFIDHDDRAAKPIRISRARYSVSGDNGWQSLPVGWRNVRKSYANLFATFVLNVPPLFSSLKDNEQYANFVVFVRRNDDVLNDDDNHSSYRKKRSEKTQLMNISKKEDVDCCHNLSVNSLMNWDYCEESECGPKYWPNANGRNQSPINLDLSLIKHSIMSPLKFLNYDMKLKGEIINNGHSVQVTLRFGSNAPEIQGGGFDQAYRLVQYHLHWGLHDNEGSEHTLAGLHYPAELHLVHEGITNPNKIAVIGVFFMLGDDDKALHQECVVLNKIIDPAKSEAVQEILLDDKLPKIGNHFGDTVDL